MRLVKEIAKVPFLCLLQVGMWLAAAPLAAAPPSTGSTIKKCQDAQGQWHYGDTAAAECATARITEIDEEGRKIGEIAAPTTSAEREALRELERKDAETKAQAEQRRLDDQRLLRAYETEADLLRARDQRLAHIDHTMKGNAQLLAGIQERLAGLEKRAGDGQPSAALAAARRQVADYETANDELRRQRERVADDFERELAAWRAAWNRGRDPAPAPELPKPPAPGRGGSPNKCPLCGGR